MLYTKEGAQMHQQKATGPIDPTRVYGRFEQIPRNGERHRRKKANRRRRDHIDRLNAMRQGTIPGTGVPSGEK